MVTWPAHADGRSPGRNIPVINGYYPCGHPPPPSPMNAPEIHFHSAPTALTLRDRLDQNMFNALYARSLVYNTCWEDPAVDRRALQLGADDTVMVISSAGCNTLDYVTPFAQPKRPVM